MSFIVKKTITDELVEGILANAFDHGISYWAAVKEDSMAGAPDDTWRHQLPLRERGFVVLEDSSGEDGFPEEGPFVVEGGVILNRESLQRGLTIMGEKYPRHMADMLSEDDDAITADVLVQCAVFGEVVFG